MTGSPRHDRRQKMFGRARLGLVLAALAPLTAFAAVVGYKFNVWSVDFALDLLTLKVALGLTALGVFGAVYAAIAGLAERRYAGSLGLAAVVISAVTVAGFGWHFTLMRDARGMGDVSTNAGDPPGFNERIMVGRQRGGADPLSVQAGAGGCAVAFLPTQVAPGVVAYGLDKAGVDIRGAGVGGGGGTWISFWYNRRYSAVVRVRPGRTDVRVTAWDRKHDRGQACRLAQRIVAGMTP
jgi:hypothetical protein